MPRVARLNPNSTPEGVFARLAFVEIAGDVELRVVWRPLHLNRTLVVRAFRGLKLVGEQRFELSEPGPGEIVIHSAEGLSEILLMLDGAPLDLPDELFGWLEWVRLRFRSVAEVQGEALDDDRCQATGAGSARPGGRFAWLPNQRVRDPCKTRVTAAHEGMGALVRAIPQALRFRTKGLTGLNWSERPGAEFEPYVETAYPGPGRPLYRNEPVLLTLNEKSDIFRAPDPPRPDDPDERRQQVDWVFVVSCTGGAGPAERLSRPDRDWIVAHRSTAPTPRPGRRPVDVLEVAAVQLRNARIHRPYDPAEPEAAPASWPARAVLRAVVQVGGGAPTVPAAFVERMPFEAGDETALLSTEGGPWRIEDGAIAPSADTAGATSIAIFGDPAWRTFSLAARVEPREGRAGVAVAVRGTPAGAEALLFVVEGDAGRLRALRRQGGIEAELENVPLPGELVAPFLLDVSAFEDAWEVSVGEARIRFARDLLDVGRLALAVSDAGRVLDLRVEPLDLYRFEFSTSRYADFGAHIASWSGRLGVLPEAVPATADLPDLVAATPLGVLMARGADPLARQRAFGEWCAQLGVLLRATVERLEISRRDALGGAAFLLLESPEPIPFSEDVTVVMRRSDGTSAEVPLAILSDGPEKGAFLVPLAGATSAVLEPGTYEVHWKLDRVRYRTSAADADGRLVQEITMTLTIE